MQWDLAGLRFKQGRKVFEFVSREGNWGEDNTERVQAPACLPRRLDRGLDVVENQAPGGGRGGVGGQDDRQTLTATAGQCHEAFGVFAGQVPFRDYRDRRVPRFRLFAPGWIW